MRDKIASLPENYLRANRAKRTNGAGLRNDRAGSYACVRMNAHSAASGSDVDASSRRRLGTTAQVSVASSIGYLAGLVGPPVIGFLAESVGLLSSLWLLAVMFLVAFAAARSLTPTV